MYAMDQTMHFEHRADDRQAERPLSRSERRRSGVSSSNPMAGVPRPETEADPTHEFLD